MSQTNKKLRAQLEDCRRAMRAAREAISIAQRYVPMEWKRTMLNSIEYLTEQLDEMRTFDSGLIPDNLNIPKQEYKMADNKHFEPVTARSLTNQIMRVIKGIYLANTEGLRNVEEDIYSTIEPHIRKPSDDDKSVPQRCEEAYNEAVKLIEGFVGEFTHDVFMNLRKAADKFLQKPNPFKEADIFKDPIFKAAMDELDREKEAEVLLRELKSYYTVCDPPNPNTINFNRSAEGIFKKIAKFLEEGRATSPARIPFDLELAKQGHKVVTRNGRDVKIVADDLSGDYPVLATIIGEDEYKTFAAFTSDGEHIRNRGSQHDLFILKEPETLEIQIWRDKNDRSYLLTTPNQSGYSKYYEADCELIKTITVTI